MKSNYSTLSTFIICFSLVGLAYAHGEKAHDDKNDESFDAVENEFGSFDPALQANRTINVSMSDNMRFTPASIEVNAGDVIKFVVANDGALQHEFVLGTADSLAEHNEMMKKFPGMEHDEPYMAHVDPGSNTEITWKFSESGAFEFACLLPGHFDAGMRGTVQVN